MQTFYMIAGMALVTFGLRYLLLPLSGRLKLSATIRRALGYVPPVVLTAIIVPAVLIPDGNRLQLNLANAYLAGALITALIGKLCKNLLVTILGGMAAFAVWQYVTNSFKF